MSSWHARDSSIIFPFACVERDRSTTSNDVHSLVPVSLPVSCCDGGKFSGPVGTTVYFCI